MNKLILPLSAVALALYLAVSRGDSTVELSDDTPRGIRNNNAGNIRYNAANQWNGQVGKDAAGFAIFLTPFDGLRAMAKLLNNYMTKYNLHTISQIINRYAPPNENNTSNYSAFLAGKMGISEHELLDPSILPELIKYMVIMENGYNPYSDDLINSAVASALGG